VSGKLSLVFGVVIAFLLILSVGTIWSSRNLAQKTQDVFDNNLKPIALLGQVRENIPHTRVLLRDMIIFTDSAAVQGFLKKIQARVTENNANIALYQNMISSKEAEEQALFQDFAIKLKDFRDARQIIIQLVLENRRSEGIVLLETQCIPKSEMVIAALQKLTDFHLNQAEQAAQSSRASTFTILIGAGLVCFLCLALAIIGRIVLQRSIAEPLLEITQKAQEVERGNIHQEVRIRSDDELGKLSLAFNAMVASIRKGIESINAEKASVEAKVVQAVQQSEQERLYLETSAEKILSMMEKFSRGDLRVRVNNEDSKGIIGQIFEGFNHSVRSVERLVQRVIINVRQTTTISTHISLASKQMAATSQEQAAQITQIASSIEEMARSIHENAQHASRVNTLTAQAGDNALQGADVVQSAVSKIQEIATAVSDAAQVVEKLGNSSAEIGEIVQVIEEIADQTNLLALNAAIEAARAGDQGRGFAVVADEVRKLAERTAQATKQISFTIKQIQNDTERAVNGMQRGNAEVKQGLTLAQEAGEALKKIVAGTSEVQAMVKFSAIAMEQQSSTAEEIAKSIDQMAAAIEETTSSLSEIATSTESLEGSVDDLQSVVNHFEVNAESPVAVIDAHHRKQLL
jgi:methyl-accepting chemotaxis protein